MMPLDLHAVSVALRDSAPAIGNHLWQSTAFAVLVWGLVLLMRKNSAQVRFGLWLVASIKFLLPFSLLMALGGVLPRPHHAVVTMPVYSAVDTAGLPFDEAAVQAISSTAMPAAVQGERWLPTLPPLLFGLWLCGVTAALMRWIAGWWRVNGIRHAAHVANHGREVAILRRLEGEMPGHRRIRPLPLLLSADSMEPGVLGILRPVVLWPAQLSEQLDDEQIAAILAHELMHVRRHDNLTALLHMLVQAAFWFHPAVWWMGKQMVAERELACDEAVVAMGSRRGIYAESLLKTVRFCVESPLACAAGITGADLKKRVQAIMRGRLIRLGWARKAALAGLGVVAIVAPVIFGMLRMIPLYGQVADAAGPLPAFEVATIKPSGPDRPGKGFITNGRHFSTLNTTASDLLQYAYGIQARQIVDAPAWVDADKFDIAAVADENRPDVPNVWNLMVRKLLADRFGLTFHHDTRELPVYELRIGKNGPKLTKSSAGDGPSELYFSRTSKSSAGMTVHARNATMAGLAKLLQANLQRPVVDQTGLPGTFDFTINFTDTIKSGDAASLSGEADAPSIFTAIQEQIGLKLEAAKGPADVVVIDHIEKSVFDSTKAEAAPVQGLRLMNVAMVRQVASSTTPAPAQTRAGSSEEKFAVSTVKPSSAATSDSSGIYTGHGRLDGKNVTLKRCIIGAYGIGPHQVVGGPDWIDTLRWDIEAKADQDINDDATLNAMQANLCADRFKLVMHKEIRTLPAYVLEIDKGGPKIEKATGGDSDTEMSTGKGGRANLKVRNTDMDLFAAVLARKMDLPVVNQTGLKGIYNFDLQWTPDGTNAANGLNPLSIFTAIQELGLKLRPAKAPVEVLVIDHAEMPSAN